MASQEDLERTILLISRWLAEIRTKNAVDYYDINKVSEGVAQILLKEIYDYELENLNQQKRNHPCVDLGDKINKIAFQITSRKDAQKVYKTLEKFTKGLDKIYTNGIYFLILNTDSPRLKVKTYKKIYPGFDPNKHVLTDKNLTREIKVIYEQDEEKFRRIKCFLEDKFGEGKNISSDRRNALKWVEKVVEDKFGSIKENLIDLNRRCVPDIEKEIRDRELENPMEQEHENSLNSSITDIFEMRNRALLILGQPASGKTVTLHELTREFVKRAKHDPDEPIPVVLNLSSWGEKTQSFHEWMQEELNEIYRISKKSSSKWLENRELVLMLDGLDQVDGNRREACVRNIKDIYKLYSLDIVLCCRLEEYKSYSTLLDINEAIIIQPLTMNQIELHLANFGPEVTSLYETIKKDTKFKELATSPLMLNIMVETYRNKEIELSTDNQTQEEVRARIFGEYVDRMFENLEKTKSRYERGETMKWLGWIARAMKRSKQDKVFVEGIQPTWLPIFPDRLLYNALVRLFGVLSLISVVVLLDIADFFLFGDKTISFALDRGLSYGLAFAAAFLSGSLLPLRFPKWLATLLASILGTLLVISLDNSLSIQWSGLLFLLFAPFFIALAGVSVSDTKNIKIVEELVWTERGVIKAFSLIGLIYVAFLVLVYFLTGFPSSFSEKRSLIQIIELTEQPWYLFLLAVVVVSMFSYQIVKLTGLVKKAVGKPRAAALDRGIRRLARNPIQLGVNVTIIMTAFTLMSYSFNLSMLGAALQVGIYSGLLAGFFLGGGAPLIQHIILRLLLTYKGYVPLRLVNFLNHCSSLTFLPKSGGGYEFFHDWFLEYLTAQKVSQNQ